MTDHIPAALAEVQEAVAFMQSSVTNVKLLVKDLSTTASNEQERRISTEDMVTDLQNRVDTKDGQLQLEIARRNAAEAKAVQEAKARANLAAEMNNVQQEAKTIATNATKQVNQIKKQSSDEKKAHKAATTKLKISLTATRTARNNKRMENKFTSIGRRGLKYLATLQFEQTLTERVELKSVLSESYRRVIAGTRIKQNSLDKHSKNLKKKSDPPGPNKNPRIKGDDLIFNGWVEAVNEFFTNQKMEKLSQVEISQLTPLKEDYKLKPYYYSIAEFNAM